MTSSVLRRVPFHPRKHRLDIIGALLMMSAAVALLLALSWGGRSYEWISAQTGALLLTSAILWGLFAWRLVSTKEPFLPLTVLGNPVVRCATLAGACNMGTLVGMTIFVPLYFEVVLHLASQSGMALIPLHGRHRAATSTITGRLMMHVARYKRMSLTGPDDRHRVPGAAGDLAGLDADGPGAVAAVHHRLWPRHRVSGFHRAHAECGVARADGRRHRLRQFLPRAVFRTGGGGAGRHRARRAGWCSGMSVEMLARTASAPRTRLCVSFRVPRLRAGAVIRHGVSHFHGRTAAEGPHRAFAGCHRAHRTSHTDPGGVGAGLSIFIEFRRAFFSQSYARGHTKSLRMTVDSPPPGGVPRAEAHSCCAKPSPTLAAVAALVLVVKIMVAPTTTSANPEEMKASVQNAMSIYDLHVNYPTMKALAAQKAPQP